MNPQKKIKELCPLCRDGVPVRYWMGEFIHQRNKRINDKTEQVFLSVCQANDYRNELKKNGQ